VLAAVLFVFAGLAGKTEAVAPTPEVIAKWRAEGVLQENISKWEQFKKRGGCAPLEHPVFHRPKQPNSFAAGTQAVDTVHVIVILVDFTDNPFTGGSVAATPTQFDSVLFTDRTVDSIYNPSGSMTDYYKEISYGQFYIKGDIYGWYRMPQNYSYYVGSDMGLTNGQLLANDAVNAAHADPSVDFSKYDHDGDGNCDGVIVIHAGPGAEEVGTGIWSHKYHLPSAAHYDGVTIYNYTLNPEEFQSNICPIGVFCHEYGHFIGLPDLYDTENLTGLSEGLGSWSLMASGNYNSGSKKPAHMDAWCKAQVGFLSFTDLDTNLYNQAIPQVETNPVVYRLSDAISTSAHEYWLVENRELTGFDVGLKAPGLLIYHVDNDAPDNTNPFDYHVALEQADGQDQLALAGSRGDAGDPFPGFTENRNFNDFTLPNSRVYNGDNFTGCSVWDISDADSIMYADLDISYSRPWITMYGADSLQLDDSFYGNNDGSIDPGEKIQFFFHVRNWMYDAASNVHATLTCGNPNITFTTSSVTVPGQFNLTGVSNASYPIEFIVPDSITPQIDSFYLSISCDSLPGVAGSETFTRQFAFEQTIGKPNILVVDADRGQTYDQDYVAALHSARVPADVWHKDSQGTPAIGDLIPYDMVFWMTGDSASGVISSADIAVMKQYFDAGKNLMLSTAGGVKDINDLDPSFLADYFHATYNGSLLFPIIDGVAGNSIGDGLRFIPLAAGFKAPTKLLPVNGGEAALYLQSITNACGVCYAGSYRSVLLGFGAEFIDDNKYYLGEKLNTKADLLGRIVSYFGGLATSVYDGQPFARLPQSFDLEQNYPNPFNPTTTISYTLRSSAGAGSKQARTNLAIYNILGMKVRTLVDEVQVPGSYRIEWDGRDRNGDKVASGIYFYRLTRGDDAETKKMMLIK
jgi:M6 family metalloprotease-like protein